MEGSAQWAFMEACGHVGHIMATGGALEEGGRFSASECMYRGVDIRHQELAGDGGKRSLLHQNSTWDTRKID